MTWTIYKGDMSEELKYGLTAWGGTLGVISHFRTKRFEALGRFAGGAFKELSVGIAQLDCDVTESLFVMSNCLLKVKISIDTLTPEMALTSVDLPCATCPMVPMLMVA